MNYQDSVSIKKPLANGKRSKENRLWFRSLVQILFFLLILLISINNYLVENGQSIPFLPEVSLHAICPFGGVVSFYQLLTVGTLVQKIHESSTVLMGIVFILTILFGPVFCGWICPLGTVQEWVSKIGKKIFKRKHNHFIPAKVDQTLRYLRYLVLGWVIYMTARSGQLIFADYDPYHALFNLWSSEVAIGGLIILGITLAGSFFVERPWCKYACPYGALLGIFNLFRIFQIRRNESTCTLCSACNRSCPMNIPVMQKKVIRDHQCISCLKCTSSEGSCPVPATVEYIAGGK